MSFVIHGLGTANPPNSLTPTEGLAVARTLVGSDARTCARLGLVYARSGANRRSLVIAGPVVRDLMESTRHTGSPFLPDPDRIGVGPTTAERMAIYAAEAGPLAVRAASGAMTEAGFPAGSITHLVTVSCTGFAAPGVDLALIGELGLKPTVERTHVGFMGCHGALNGLRVANAIATANPAARVLLCAVELCSLHLHYGTDADKMIANAIFADGAASIVGCGADSSSDVLTPEPPLFVGPAPGEPEMGSNESRLEGEGAWSLAASGSCVIPGSAADMSWTVGNHGFEMVLSRRVPGLIATHLRPWLEAWLGNNGLSLKDVRSWAIHPGGPKILTAVEESLELSTTDLAPSRGVFVDYGNMSSPTVLFIVDRLRKANAPRPCVALGFGPGLVAEGAIFT